MGCFVSKKVFKVRDDIEGQGEIALDIFYELGLEQSDINVLYTAFWDIDADGSGTIMPIELFAYFEVESGEFEKSIFTLFDEDDSGLINFMEFVCSMWNILTLSREDMGCLSFLIADRTGEKKIKYSDVARILEVMHKKKVDNAKDHSLQNIMTTLRNTLPRDINIEDFTAFTRKHPSICIPMHMLQMHLRRQIIGESFWQRVAQARAEDEELNDIRYMATLQRRILSQNRKFMLARKASTLEKARKQRRGLGPGGDQRDLKERKQSMLLQHFALRQNSEGRARQERAGVYASSEAQGKAATNKKRKGQNVAADADAESTDKQRTSDNKPDKDSISDAKAASGKGESRKEGEDEKGGGRKCNGGVKGGARAEGGEEPLPEGLLNDASLKRQPSTRIHPRKRRSDFMGIMTMFGLRLGGGRGGLGHKPPLIRDEPLVRSTDKRGSGGDKKGGEQVGSSKKHNMSSKDKKSKDKSGNDMGSSKNSGKGQGGSSEGGERSDKKKSSAKRHVEKGGKDGTSAIVDCPTSSKKKPQQYSQEISNGSSKVHPTAEGSTATTIRNSDSSNSALTDVPTTLSPGTLKGHKDKKQKVKGHEDKSCKKDRGHGNKESKKGKEPRDEGVQDSGSKQEECGSQSPQTPQAHGYKLPPIQRHLQQLQQHDQKEKVEKAWSRHRKVGEEELDRPEVFDVNHPRD